MASALIGHTGFVGSNLRRQFSFSHFYRSTNIEEIEGNRFDLLVVSGAPAEKWRANQEPETDLANLERLMKCLRLCRADRVVLISTIDVYKDPKGVDENSEISISDHHPYGRHRYMLESFVCEHFPRTNIIRLPGLYGPGLKKNLVFDLLSGGKNTWTHCQSTFQFYDTTRLWNDCKIAIEAELPLVNLAVEPVGAAAVAKQCFGICFDHVTDAPPATYDMHTCYASNFGKAGSRYISTRQECIAGITHFVRRWRSAA